MVTALKIETVDICDNCVGDKWTIEKRDQVVKLIATIAMGQAVHAAKIIQELRPAEPKLKNDELKKAAIKQLTIPSGTEDQMNAAVWRRDGFLMEAISWIAAQQQGNARTYLKEPHLKSTTQGIDGLMIELDAKKDIIARATIFEDKCSEDPEKIFANKVLPGFLVHHKNERGPELISIASSLIEKSGMDSEAAVEAAGRVLDLEYRRYRVALAVTKADDSKTRREKVFKKYETLENIEQSQRLGASFVVSGELRKYFSTLASEVIEFIKTL